LVTDLFARLLLNFDAETAHALVLRGLGLYGHLPILPPTGTETEFLGIKFRGQLGLAAGFDKNADVIAGLSKIGFSFIEIGSVTLHPWAGNPRPRIKRFESDEAIVNHMGLPSKGVNYVISRLKSRKTDIPILGNIAVTPGQKQAPEQAAEEYRQTADRLAEFVDAVVLNLSCPNTSDGRAFSSIEGVSMLATAFNGWAGPPLLAKFGPSEPDDIVKKAVNILLENGFKGIVATNTVPVDDYKGFNGGLSGRPIFETSLARVKMIREVCEDGPVVIGCGGVFSMDDFERMRDAGADLVEILTGLILKGPALVREIQEQ